MFFDMMGRLGWEPGGNLTLRGVSTLIRPLNPSINGRLPVIKSQRLSTLCTQTQDGRVIDWPLLRNICAQFRPSLGYIFLQFLYVDN